MPSWWCHHFDCCWCHYCSRGHLCWWYQYFQYSCWNCSWGSRLCWCHHSTAARRLTSWGYHWLNAAFLSITVTLPLPDAVTTRRLTIIKKPFNHYTWGRVGGSSSYSCIQLAWASIWPGNSAPHRRHLGGFHFWSYGPKNWWNYGETGLGDIARFEVNWVESVTVIIAAVDSKTTIFAVTGLVSITAISFVTVDNSDIVACLSQSYHHHNKRFVDSQVTTTSEVAKWFSLYTRFQGKQAR